MKIRGMARLHRAGRYLQSYFVKSAVILLYHRVDELASDPQLLSVTSEHFAQHLEIIRQYASSLTLADLVTGIEARNIPDRAVVITFDDGYRDNLTNAKPLLERYEMPATIYVATGNIAGQSEFYWDELEQILLHPGEMPPSVDLQIQGQVYSWKLGSSALYTESDARRNQHWNVNEAPPTVRQQMYADLCALLRPLPQSERDLVLKSLKSALNLKTQVRPSHRVMTAEELNVLAQTSLIDIGAHTVTHPSLAACSPDIQRYEISTSKAALETMTGRSVTSFSYPFGTKTDYTSLTTALVRETDFVNACSNYPGTVRSTADRFQLPRFLVRNWDSAEFAANLAKMFRS